MDRMEPEREHGLTQPAQRALSAMALAARRASQSTAGGRSKPERLTSGPERLGEPVPHTARARSTERPNWERTIRTGVLAVGAVVVSLSAIVVALKATGGTRSSAPSHSSGRGTSRMSGPTAPPSPSGSASASNPTISTTIPESGAPGGPPEISSIAPTSGTSGQTVTLSGTNLFSPDGQIQAYFDGADAPTSCPVQTTCTVTVPNLPGGPANVPVKVVTEGGDSNTLFFEYTNS